MRCICLWVLIVAANYGAQTADPNPASLSYVFPSNSATPPSVSVTVSSSGPMTVNAVTQSGGNWLTVTPSTASATATLTVTMDPSGLPDGTYQGDLTISLSASSKTVPVIIAVGDPGPQLPTNGIVNAASYQGGAISPGEIIAVFGTSVGPKIPYSAQIWDGVMTNKLAGARVWIDNTPAPVIYAYPNQLAVVVLYEIAGKAAVQVQVENLVARTPPFSVPVQNATPGFFTADGSGKGQLVALNQDNSLNSASSPAPQGSVVVLYATGMGVLSPAAADGTIVSSTSWPAPALPIQVTIGAQSAQIPYAGAAPGLVVRAIQINVRVPMGIATGNAAVVATVGTVSSPNGCTISVH